MWRIVLISTSGQFEYLSESLPDFEDMNRAMKELLTVHTYRPLCWLIAAGAGEA